MSRIRTLIVDDEPLALTSLSVLLRADPDIDLVGECDSGEAAIEAIQRFSPDLLFLDVQMPVCDGFAVLERLGSATPPAIVFVTAYDRYALKAFEVEALDYLLKPFDDARFERTLARAKEQVRGARSSAADAGRIIVRNAGRVSFLRISEIDWIEAADYYACLHVGGKTHMIRRPMADLERQLDPARFCRIHRSTIVNRDRIQTMELNSSGEYEVVLRDGTRLRMSRRYRARVIE